MDVSIKLIDKTLPLPTYQTGGSVAFDIYSRIDEVVGPKETKFIPANLIIKTPTGFMLLVAARSSLARKKGLQMANSVGIIDQDFCGEEDELKLHVYNFTSEISVIQKGERLAQGIFVKIEKAEWQEVALMQTQSRGGFGSTGH